MTKQKMQTILEISNKIRPALAGWHSWLESYPVQQKATGSISRLGVQSLVRMCMGGNSPVFVSPGCFSLPPPPPTTYFSFSKEKSTKT